jgi:hypothetical protein
LLSFQNYVHGALYTKVKKSEENDEVRKHSRYKPEETVRDKQKHLLNTEVDLYQVQEAIGPCADGRGYSRGEARPTKLQAGGQA